MRKIISAIAVAMTMAVPASAATVTNGSFENLGGQAIKGSWELFPNLPGWSGNPNVEVQTNPTIKAVDAHTGRIYLELKTNKNSGISQVVSFSTSGLYELTFFYSPRVVTTENANDLTFGIEGVFSEMILGAPNGEFPWGEWTKVTQRFSIDGPRDHTLFFSSLGDKKSKGCGKCGALIDTVSISAVPLPAGGLLLLGAFGAFAMVRRRA